ERERIDLYGVKKIFAALLVRKEIVDRSKESVAAELPRIARAFMTHRFCQVHTMLERLPRKNIRPSHAVEDRGNLHQHVAAIADGLLLIAGILRAQVADPALRQAGG